MKLGRIAWVVCFLVFLITSSGFSDVKNLDLSKASGSNQTVYGSGRWELKTDPTQTQTILSETRPQMEGATHQNTVLTPNTFPTVKLGTSLGGNGSDGTFDLSLGGAVGGCNGPGMSWTTMSFNNFSLYGPEEWSGPTCLINTDVKSVFNFTTVNIPQGTHVRATGSNALKIYATGNVTVAGVISVSALRETPGAGGYGPAQGPGAGSSLSPGVLGWGALPSGGGFGGLGGSGFNNDPNANPTFYVVSGGNSYSTPSDRGGSGGGNFTLGQTTIPGGAGGGVLFLESASTIHIASTGKIFAIGGTSRGIYSNGTLFQEYEGCSWSCYVSGAGAGGRVSVVATAITGSGLISVRGGWTPITGGNWPSYTTGLGNGAGGRVNLTIYGNSGHSLQIDTYHGAQRWNWGYNGGEGILQVATLPLENAPLHCQGSFISAVHDLLDGNLVRNWEYSTSTPPSTSVQLRVRHGSTPSYDPVTWSGWVNAPLSGGILPIEGSRYVQYKVDMTGAGGTGGSCSSSPTFGYVTFKRFSYYSGPGIVATDEVQGLRGGLVNSVSINQNTPQNTSVRWAVSTDGATWKKYANGVWENVNAIALGNTASEISAVPSDKWQELGFGLIRFAFALETADPGKTPSVSGISVNYTPLQISAGNLVCPQTIYRGLVGNCSVTANSNYTWPLSYVWTAPTGGTINPSDNTAEVSFDTKGLKSVRVRISVNGVPEADVTRTASIDVIESPKPSITVDGPRSVFRGQEVQYSARVICPQGFECQSEFVVEDVTYSNPATVKFMQVRNYQVTGAAWIADFPDTRVENTIRVFVSEIKKPFVSISAPRLAEVGVPITLRAHMSAPFGTPVGYWTLPDGTRVDGPELIYTPTEKTDNLRLSYSAYIEDFPDTLVIFESRTIKVDTYELPQFKIKSYVRNFEGYAPYAIALGVTGDMTKVINYGVKLTHQWDLGDGTVREGANPKMVSHIYSHPGTYTITLTVNDERGNSTSDSITLTVLEVPEVTIQSFKVTTSNKFNRVPVNVFVRPTVTGGHPRLDRVVGYEWTVNGELVGIERVASVNFNEPGDYVIGLTVTTASGKTAYGEVPITVNPNQPPRCTISYVDNPRLKTTKIESSCYDPDGRIVEYYWDLGNGQTSKNARVFVKYEESGTYNVTLRVKDNSGDEAVFTEAVTVQR